jgi:molecular chaperone GrpE
MADLDNYRKRMEKELASFKVYANEQLLSDLTVVMDNFSRALDSGCAKAEDQDFYKGISMIYRYLKEVLERWGLKEYSAGGEVFDPQRHDAVRAVETNDLEPNTIVEEISKGYMLGEKILKPAQVTVAKPCPEKKEEGGNQNG